MNPEEEALLAKLQQAKMMMGGQAPMGGQQPDPMAPPQAAPLPSYKGISAQPTAAGALAQALRGWQSGRQSRADAKGSPTVGMDFGERLRRAGKIGGAALEHPMDAFKSLFG